MSDSGFLESSGKAWVVLSDVALAMLFVMLLFVLAQFLHYQKISILETIAARQDTVATGVRAAVDAALAADVLDGSTAAAVTIERLDDYRQRISFQSEALFLPCRFEFSRNSKGGDLVNVVGRELAAHESFFVSVQIEGHTDNRPATNCDAVQDNWQLSSRRATSTLALLRNIGIAGDRLASVGHGEFQPIDSDTTELARSRNRRIELVLLYAEPLPDVEASLR